MKNNIQVIPWTEIGSFNNVKKYVTVVPEIVNGNSAVTYRAKIKLHGENHAIQIHNDGSIVCQSRTVILTKEKDNKGFAAWVSDLAPLLRGHIMEQESNIIIYGEWCGQGVQSGVAINDIGKKIFAVFAARPLDPEDDRLIVEPTELQNLTLGLSEYGMHVLPWYNFKSKSHVIHELNQSIEIDWSADAVALASKTTLINDCVADVEENDPWVEKTFGVKGTGEGLVYYPISHPGYANYCNLVFKAKGEAHRVIKTKVAAQVNAESAENADLFAGMVLTLARLEQGARAVSDDGILTFSQKSIGKFMNWIVTDIQKENQDELEVSGLSWKQVQKPIGDKARDWYMSQIKK